MFPPAFMALVSTMTSVAKIMVYVESLSIKGLDEMASYWQPLKIFSIVPWDKSPGMNYALLVDLSYAGLQKEQGLIPFSWGEHGEPPTIVDALLSYRYERKQSYEAA